MGIHLQGEHRVEGGKTKMTRVLFAKTYVKSQAGLICKSEEEWNRDRRKEINEQLEEFLRLSIYTMVAASLTQYRAQTGSSANQNGGV